MHWTPFTEITAVLAVAALLGAIGLKLRQPLIISFLFAGILVGPSALGLIEGPEQIELLAGIGISLLLFVVGLRLDVGMIRTVGPVALATGLGQVLFTSLIGLGIARAFGLAWVPALYVAVALTFSSTIIIVKLLSDKKEIDSLHGRIAVGFLIVQDIVAILALIGLTAFGGGASSDEPFVLKALWIVAKGLLFLAAVVVLMRWVLPRALPYIARSPELLVLFAITWAVLLATAAEWLGFSKEVGAFLAGVSLASTDQRDAIGARLVVLRDFLLLFFFIDLGARLNLAGLGAEVGRAAVFSAFVLVGNPLIVMTIMGVMGYRRRTGFMSGLAVAQISEFSLILAALGVSLGHIGADSMNLITLVGLVTIFASTYMILYSGPLYGRLSGLLRVFERRNAYREAAAGAEPVAAEHLILVMGLGHYGSEIATRLQRHGWSVLAVDFDPAALARGRRLGLPVLYGDIADPEMLAQLPLDHAHWVVCAVRDRALNFTLLSLLREAGFAGRVAVAVGSPADAEPCRARGAHLVLQPFRDAAELAVEVLTGAMQALPGLVDWPAKLEEVVLQPGSVLAGKALRELSIRGELGVSVLAVSRAGRVQFNPGPDVQLYPGDRLVLLGEPEALRQAAESLRQRELGRPPEQASAFAVGEVAVESTSPWAGASLAELDFRNRHGARIIGIRRGGQALPSPRASDRLEPGDRLVVGGSPQAIDRLTHTPASPTDGRPGPTRG